jgi:hypothetical protein
MSAFPIRIFKTHVLRAAALLRSSCRGFDPSTIMNHPGVLKTVAPGAGRPKLTV